ncbi:type I secretion system permease/ATPase [Geminicoccus flavidas]|uniref:type I secretion system permease/ATPase n=1 Tax=Geminicoccus flavidas TaxID=2506407 RepID=UPI00135B7DAF|nr:type I secretion system permease/ATPase [Geminicoccus flavidas]
MTEVRPDDDPGRAVGDPTADPSAVADPVPPQAEAGAKRQQAPQWRIRAATSQIDDPLLASLVALTHLLDRPSSADSLRAGLPLEDERLTPALFPRAAERAGLDARLVRRGLRDIDELALPCVLLLRDRRSCVLISRGGDKARVIVPETGLGVREIELAELERIYTGHAFFARPELELNERDKRQGAPRFGNHWFWSTLFKQWPVYIEVVIAALLINVFSLVSPLFVMNVYDRVVPNNALETLWVLAAGALIIFAFDFVLKTARGYFVDTAGRASDVIMASRIFEQVLGIRLAGRPASAGAFASNLREFETLRDFFTSATVTALVDLPFIVLFLAIVFLIGGDLAIIPGLAVPIVLGVGLLIQLPLDRIVKETFRETAMKHGLLVEAINGLETIKSVAAEGRMQRSWERLVAATAKTANKARFLSSLTVNFASTAANLVYVGMVVMGVYKIAEGELTVGALIACTIIGSRAMAPLGQVAALLTRFHQSKTSLETLNNIMALPTERPDGARFVHRPHLRGDIEFKNVTFTYPNQKLPALRNVSFKIAAGERVALIGRIGSGKTTIEKLVLGLYEPQEGAVLVDGTDVRQLDPADLRRSIGCVPQDVYLFQGSLRDNITLGAAFVDDQAVLRAARISGVEEFATRHPMGYDLHVGERGEALSGGQRQAVAVARALLLDPPILILDEPTSAMDTGAENRLKARLAREVPGRTMLLVTHRQSMLTLADRILVIDNGRVAADGPKEKVLKALASGQIRGER